jgi:hypothetical protein
MVSSLWADFMVIHFQISDVSNLSETSRTLFLCVTMSTTQYFQIDSLLYLMEKIILSTHSPSGKMLRELTVQ